MSIDSTALAKLRTVLSPSAAAHLRGEPGYSNKRWALNAEKEAAVVVCPATPEDVVQILAFVQGKAPYESQSKLSFSVKSGGYDWSGTSSCEGGLVIDLRPNMQDIRIDPTAKLAFVGAGCIWGQVDQAAIIHGLAAVAGISDQIGVGGLTLDGGFGWLCGQHGLVIDNVVRMTVVTASGNILTTSREENSDLFWALRGGGNNFAIVVEIVYQLHEQQSQVYTSMLVFPPAKVGPVFSELNKWLSERTDAENAICVFTAGTAGQPVLVLNFVYNGESDEGARRFERFKKLDPVRDQSGAIPYTKLNTLQNEHTKAGELRLLEGNFIPATATGITAEFAVDIYSTWLKFIKNYPAAEKSTVVIELFHPEKWSSVAPDATAYTNRYPVYNVIYMVNWVDHTFTQLALDATHRLDDEFTKLRKEHFNGNPLQSATLSRFIGKNNSLETKYGKNYPRLMEIKRKYDSNGLFGKWVPTRSQPTV